MSLDPSSASSGGRTFLPDLGLQPARCFAIIDLGSRYPEFNGQKKNYLQPYVLICFELTKFMNVYKEGEPAQPIRIMQEYPFSTGDKAKLPAAMKSWSAGTDPCQVLNLKPYLGQYCYLNMVLSKDGKYANIADGGRGVASWIQGTPFPAKHYQDTWFDLDQFTWDSFGKLPERAKKLIRLSNEWHRITQTFGQEPQAAQGQGYQQNQQPAYQAPVAAQQPTQGFGQQAAPQQGFGQQQPPAPAGQGGPKFGGF